MQGRESESEWGGIWGHGDRGMGGGEYKPRRGLGKGWGGAISISQEDGGYPDLVERKRFRTNLAWQGSPVDQKS